MEVNYLLSKGLSPASPCYRLPSDGWDGRDSRVAMNLQKERAGVEIKVPMDDIKASLERDGK
jgi:hypothetical protein